MLRQRHSVLDTIASDDFFENVDRYPANLTYYVDPVKAMLPSDWIAQRSGIWMHHRKPDSQLPDQGWKLHLSATTHTASDVLAAVIPILAEHGVPFKHAIDRKILSLMNSKPWDRGGSGKFITVYPATTEQFLQVGELLRIATQHLDGPYILSDRRFRDSRVVYYRYGTISARSALTAYGSRASVFARPNGELEEDRRGPAFYVPPWETDPVSPPAAGDGEARDPKDLPILNERYRVGAVLGFSNSGGVYVAEDLERNRVAVVVKEARPLTGWTSRDDDSTVKLRKEYRLLKKLEPFGIAPKAIDLFTQWEHLFLVQEPVGTVSLQSHAVRSSPLLRTRATGQDLREYQRTVMDVARALYRVIAIVHEHSIVFGDLSPSNLLWQEDTKSFKLIDFEGACEVGIDPPAILSTDGFGAPGVGIAGRGATFDDDWYAFASLLLTYALGVAAMFSLDRSAVAGRVKQVLADAQFPTELAALLEDLLLQRLPAGTAESRVAAVMRSEPSGYLEPTVVEPQPQASRDQDARAIVDYIVSRIDTSRDDCVVPADFRVFGTNSLGLAFGASGVALALARSNFPVPQTLLDYIERRLPQARSLPPGLLTGAAGIAWTLLDLGRIAEARALLDDFAQHPLLERAPDLSFGEAGCGMANLKCFLTTRDEQYLARARAVAEHLVSTAQSEGSGYFWLSNSDRYFGLAQGASGIAVFLLYLGLVDGDERLIAVAKQALASDLAEGLETQDGGLTWMYGRDLPPNVTLPYLAFGSAGVGSALLRFKHYLRTDEYDAALEKIFVDTDRVYSISAGLLKGLAGIAHFHLDGYRFTQQQRFLDAYDKAVHGLDVLKIARPEGLAFPGLYLGRISCDYGTGSAGVLTALTRRTDGRAWDLTLDEHFVAVAAPALV